MSWSTSSLVRTTLIVCITAWSCWGCTGPARTDGTFRGKTKTTAEQVRSSVEAAIVGIDAARRHHLPSAYTSTLLAEADDDASSAEATLDSIQPPSRRADRVRRHALVIIGDATDALAQARILARRSDTSGLVRLLPALRRSADRLDQLTTELGG